jgi:short subunit dehydrogenase-like uncharacterized protein
MTKKFLIYGANGYTGELITRFAVEQGHQPIIAGRNREAIETLAGAHGLEFEVFDLKDTSALEAVLDRVDAVIHCAGPFSLTFKEMADACLRTGTHYLDITGEIEVFEGLAARDAEAISSKIMMMPGVGFDVVPSDCLAAHLKKRLPSADSLQLAFFGLGRISHGTQKTMTMNMGTGGKIRRDGVITEVPAGYKERLIDFGDYKKVGVTIPWGDVSTAFHTTGIPNVEVYTALPKSARRMIIFSRYFAWLLRLSPVQKFIQSKIPPGGASDEERGRGRSYLWGRAEDASGNFVESRLVAVEGYTLTALTALKIVDKVLNDDFKIGFQTPGRAYGPDLILEISGTERLDVA